MEIRDALKTLETAIASNRLTLEELRALAQFLDIAHTNAKTRASEAALARHKHRSKLSRAAYDQNWVCRIVYVDEKGQRTERTISPIRLTRDTVNALDLGREEPRNFTLSRIASCELIPASDVLMGAETVRVLE